MYNTRIKYAIENFIDENYFLPMKNKYELKETADSGKSLLELAVEGENICVEEYDNKKRCGFLRKPGKFGMQKCIDHFLLKNNGQAWDLYMIEMKSNVGDKKWRDIKAKVRSSLLNIKALCEFLGITLNNIYTYTTYEKECFTKPENTADPKTLIPKLGERAIDYKRDEWDANVIKIKIDEIISLPHKAVKMEYDDKIGLHGTLDIKSSR